jgi:D-3-phosphoglycerate dehydrogenase
MADRMGCLMGQIIDGHLKEVAIEYTGDYQDMDMDPVTTAFLNGLLNMLASDEVNPINAPAIAKEMGIKVIETSSSDSFDYTNLMTVTVSTSKMSSTVGGTVFGKNFPRIVQVNEVRLEMVPEGYFTFIQEENIPGAIGNIGSLLGENAINIERMTTGQGPGNGSGNDIVFLRTESPLSSSILKKLQSLPTIKAVIPLEL